MKRLRIGLDLDGVLYDYADSVRRYLAAVLGRPLESFPDPVQYRFAEQWCPGMPEQEFVDHLHAGVDAGVIFRTGAPPTGAAAAVNMLLHAGHEVHVVTARNTLGSVGRAEAATKLWLREHTFRYTSLTLTTDKTSVPCDVFVEDYLSNVFALERVGVRCWLVDRPWNQVPAEFPDPPGRRRVTSVVEAAVQIMDYATEKYATYDTVHITPGQQAAVDALLRDMGITREEGGIRG